MCSVNTLIYRNENNNGVITASVLWVLLGQYCYKIEEKKNHTSNQKCYMGKSFSSRLGLI